MGIVGFTCGAFDLLHAGHILHFEEAKKYCDELIVGLHVDPSKGRPGKKHRPVQTVYERYIQLMGCKYVDYIIPYETDLDLCNILRVENINIRFLDELYKNELYKIVGLNDCLNSDIKIHYTARQHFFSSTELRERVHFAFNQDTS